MTQSQIATELGISQMHVSRLLAKSLARLRGYKNGAADRPVAAAPPGGPPKCGLRLRNS